MRVLAGDIGGTKSELALYERVDGGWEQTATERFVSADHGGVPDVVRAFLGDRDLRIDAAGLAVAGPVHDGVCRITNLVWDLDERSLSEQLGAPTVLVNDFAANAHGIGELADSDLALLQEGHVDPGGAIVLIGAGTGLGHAVAVPTKAGLQVLPGEGGHCDFAPHDDTEVALWRYLRDRFGPHVSIERAASGPGLVTIYEFVVADGLAEELAETRVQMAAEDPAAVIARRALADEDAACGKAFSTFLSLYGAEAGNYALKVLPSGGLYIAGGIAPRIVDRLRDGEFLRSFLDKGRMRPTLEQVRVSVVMNTRLGLLGARALAATRVGDTDP